MMTNAARSALADARNGLQDAIRKAQAPVPGPREAMALNMAIAQAMIGVIVALEGIDRTQNPGRPIL